MSNKPLLPLKQTRFAFEFFQGADWVSLGSNICYGAKWSSYAAIKLPVDGFIVAIRLVHKSGQVTCQNTEATNWSFWGCSLFSTTIRTYITDNKNQVIFPTKDIPTGNDTSYNLPGFIGTDTELVFRNQCTAMYGRKGKHIRIWYGDDLKKINTPDNDGRHCVDVYAIFE